MNTQQLLQHCLLAASLAGAAVCLAAVLAYHFRNQLRKLHERWLGLGPLGRVVSILAVTIAVLYGGTKSPTNDPPDTVGGGSTNPPPTMCCSPRPRLSAPPQELTTDNQQLTTLPAWHRRGAYSDWQRIDFPSSFSFPYGTNLLTSITLFAYGEILSLEPNVSSCAYGLTPSNSFLIAWQNACVNRSPTNRVDASIELFPSGVCSVRFGASQTDYPPTPPSGFFGSDQDNDWALANFPGDYDAITNKGYEVWLMEDKVGINEQNGLYKASITINQAPSTNTQAPLYLVCGPYKVVVTSSGTYSFPLEVFETYKARTYPVALPLTISTDDGYRGDVSQGLMMSAPRRMLASPPNGSFEYEIREEPRLVLSPSQIPLSGAAGTVISIWCNIAEGARRLYSSLSGLTTVSFTSPTEAEIEESIVEDSVEFIL